MQSLHERHPPLVSVPTVESAAAENGTARLTIHDLLGEARSHLARLRPAEAQAAVREGALLVDTRSQDQRLRAGTIPGSLHMPLSVLEWRVAGFGLSGPCNRELR